MGRLDIAMVMCLKMLTEELLASFWGYAGLLERIYDISSPPECCWKCWQCHRDRRSSRRPPGTGARAGLFVGGGALRIGPVFVLGHRFSGLVAIQRSHTLSRTAFIV